MKMNYVKEVGVVETAVNNTVTGGVAMAAGVGPTAMGVSVVTPIIVAAAPVVVVGIILGGIGSWLSGD